MATKDTDSHTDRLSGIDTPPVADGCSRVVLTSGPNGEPSEISASRVGGCDTVWLGYLSSSSQTGGIRTARLVLETVVTEGGVVAGITGTPSDPDRNAQRYTTNCSLVWYKGADGQTQPIGTAAFLDLPEQ